MLGYYKREKRVDLWNKYNLKIMALEDKVNNPNAFGVLSLESKEVDEKGKNLLTFVCHDKTFKKVEKNDEIVIQHLSTEEHLPQEVNYRVREVIDKFDGLITMKLIENYREENSLEIVDYDSCSGYINPTPVKLRNVSDSPYNALKKICLDFIENGYLSPLIKNILDSQSQVDFKSFEKVNDASKGFEIAKNMDGTLYLSRVLQVLVSLRC